MATLGRSPGAAPLTSADIPDNSITSAKIVAGTVAASDVAADVATQAELDTVSTTVTANEADADKIQTNIALLAFKVAVNGSLAKYDLQDQIVDEYAHVSDISGIDAGVSTNEVLSFGAYSGALVSTLPTGGDSVTSGVPSGYIVHRFDNISATEQLVVAVAGTVDVLVVAGGGSGGGSFGGGGGAGGLIWRTGYTLAVNTYDCVIGDGGAGQTSETVVGNIGVDSTFTITGGGSQVFIAKGGGKGGQGSGIPSAGDGGSGGGNGSGAFENPGPRTNEIQSDQSGDSGDATYAFGFDGGLGTADAGWKGGGGGGAGGQGGDGNVIGSDAGWGGLGKNLSSFFGTSVGDSGWFASGGGAGNVAAAGGENGQASSGGGTDGGLTQTGVSDDATDGTGGGSGGGGGGSGAGGDSGDGGSGIILIRYTLDAYSTFNSITLQSTDTEAESQPTKADMVMLVEDAGSGVATLGTHIKGFISRDSGTTFTEGTLVDEGDWGDDKRILAFHDLDIDSASQPDGVQMCYKITTHSASAVYHTKIHATSIGWR